MFGKNFGKNLNIIGKPTTKPKETAAKSPIPGKSAAKGTLKTRKTKAQEDALMSKKAVKQRDRQAEIAAGKELAPIGKKFLKLEKTAEETFAVWEHKFNVLRQNVRNTGLKPEISQRTENLVNNSLTQHKKLMNAVINNLRATHIALALIDRGKAIKADNKEVQSVVNSLENIQRSMRIILEMGPENFTKKNFQTLKSDIEKLKKETKNAKENAVSNINVNNMNNEERQVFESKLEIYNEQLKIFDEVTELFNDAQKLWTSPEVGDVTETNEETTIQIDEDKGIADILEDAINEIKKADLNDSKFWISMAAIIGLIALVLAFTAILVGLLASGTGAIVAVVVLGMLAGFSFATSVGAATNIGFESDYDYVRRELKKLLDLAPPLLKDLEKLQNKKQA